MLEISTVKTASGERRFGRVVPNATVTEIVPTHGVMYDSEDVERLTKANWQDGFARREAKARKRAAAEAAYSRKVNGIAVTSLAALFILTVGVTVLAPQAWALSLLGCVAVGDVIRRWLS